MGLDITFVGLLGKHRADQADDRSPEALDTADRFLRGSGLSTPW